MSKVLLMFVLEDWHFLQQRLKFAEVLRSKGYKIKVMGNDTGVSKKIIDLGFEWYPVHLKRKSMNPFYEIKTIFEVVRYFRLIKPNIIHAFALKAILYSSIANLFVKPKLLIYSFTGMGYLFISKKWVAKFVKRLVLLLLLLFGRRSNQLFVFQNQSDFNFFSSRIYLKEKCHLIPGSGVDTDYFKFSNESNGTCKIVLPARMLWDKGIQEFVSAAKKLLAKGLPAKFLLAGDTDPQNPAAIPTTILQQWTNSGNIEWLGRQDDMREVYAKSHIVCLPSYREGMPNVLLEAQACGRAIVSTNVPGCQDIIEEGVNGLLINLNELDRLHEKLEQLIIDPSLRAEMGINGRKIVEEKYCIEKITVQYVALYELL